MIRGSCLCGAVRFEITGKTTDIGMCHCSKCRKVSGVASNATLVVGREHLRFVSGEEHVTRFALPDGWGVWRCATCGSPVPTAHQAGGAYYVPAGLLEGDPGLRVAGHIWVDSKAPWDEIPSSGSHWRKGFDGERID